MIWVRSQDKEILVEATNFRICKGYYGGKSTHYTIDCDVHDSTFELGKYSTKEKALKVLDMIQEKVKNKIRNELYVRIATRSDDVTFNGPGVFQMPQDDEVKV